MRIYTGPNREKLVMTWKETENLRTTKDSRDSGRELKKMLCRLIRDNDIPDTTLIYSAINSNVSAEN